MKCFFSLLLVILSFSVYAQKEIKIEEVKDHIGDSVRIHSKVFGVKYFSQSKDPVTLVNIGAAYPNQLLTAVIKNDVRAKLSPEPTEDALIGKEVTLVGKLELYKGKPQIVIIDPSQFKVE